MSRAVVVTKFGLDHLEWVDREVVAPAPGEVRVRVEACSLNYRDLLMVTGRYNPRQKLPLVPLSDGAGIIEATGDNVGALRVGDRVCALFAPSWQRGAPSKARFLGTRGGPLDGLLREHVTAPADHFRKAPAHLSSREAAALPCAALTAWSALVTEGNLAAGEQVLVLGTGGVSLFALQIAKMRGATATVLSSSDKKLELARSMGADHVINYRETERWDKEVARLTGGVDHVVEVGGAGTFNRSVRAVKPGGHIALIGVLSATDEPIDLVTVLMKQVRVQGIFVGSADGFESMTRAFTEVELRPVLDDDFAMADARAAFERLDAAHHTGKITLDLS